MALTRPRYSQIYDTDYKQSVRVATTEDVGNLLASGNMTNTVDGKLLAAADRILVKDQLDAKQNGIYKVLTVGTGSNGTWIRTSDADANGLGKVTGGMTTTVTDGDVNISKTYKLSTPDPITIGVTELTFINPFASSAVGSDKQIPFNDSGVNGASANLTFDKSTNTLTITGSARVTGNLSANSYIVGANTSNSGPGYLTINSRWANIMLPNDNPLVYSNYRFGTYESTIGPSIYSFFSIKDDIGVSEAVKLQFANQTVFAANATQFAFKNNKDGNPLHVSTLGNVYVASDLIATTVNTTNLVGNPNVTVTGSVLPSANITYDLGSPTQRWREGWFSGSTIHIGDESISVDGNGKWTFTSDGAAVELGKNNDFNPPNANISGNVTATNYLFANGTPVMSLVDTMIGVANTAMKGYADSAVSTLTSNAAVQAGDIATLYANAGAQSGSIVTANTAMKGYVDGEISTTTSAISTANTAMKGYVDSVDSTKAPLASPTFSGNVTITGNLSVTGTQTTFNSNNLTLNDSLLYLAHGNSGDALDIGFVSSYNPGTYQHGGLVRDASDGIWKLFGNVATEPSTIIDFTNAVYQDLRVGNLTATGLTVSGSTAVDLNSSSTDFALGLKVGKYITGQSGSKLFLTNQSNGIYLEGGSNAILDLAGTTAYIGQSTGSGTFAVQMAVTEIQGTTASTSKTTGALKVSGGVGVTGNLNVGANLAVAANATIGGTLMQYGKLTIDTPSPATGTTDGALVVTGGAGIGGNLYAGNVQGTNLTGTIRTAAQPSITSVGTLTGLTISSNLKVTGANIVLNGSNAAPNAAVTIRGYTGGTAGSAIANHQKTLVIGGDYNQTYNSGNAAILHILDYSNDAGDSVYPIYCEDENNIVDFYVFSGNSTGALSKFSYFGGTIKINAANEPTAIVNNGTNGVGNIGASGAAFNTVFAKSTSAQYADLAEVYASDKHYVPGTVVVFGGTQEVTVSTVSHDPSVAGVVSTNPAYLMNDSVDGAAVALQGRVPCRVLGPVSKGDRVVSSDVRGVAERLDIAKYQPGCIIGKSLESVPDGEIATIEVVVGRN